MSNLPFLAIILVGAIRHQMILANGDEEGEECESSLNSALPGHLNEKVRPTHYHLIMAVDLDSNDFGGWVSIHLDVDVSLPNKIDSQLETQFIFLHAFPKLKIHPAKTKLSNKKGNVPIGIQCRSTPNDFWVIALNQSLQRTIYQLELEFDGNMDNNVESGFLGLYKGTYFDAFLNREENFAATQFQQIHARKAFPCFDEPRFKSLFVVQVKHRRKYSVLCNMKAVGSVETERGSGWLTTQCDNGEVRMPTYLVVVALTHGFNAASQTKHDILFSIWSRQELADSRRYALDKTAEALWFYQSFAGLPYPLKKFDSIGLPVFLFGAMEHWSLVTYKEHLLLLNEDSTLESKYGVTYTIAHELAHQWFGNRVTVRFWPHLWLNEAFATWFQYKGIDAMEPLWDYCPEPLLDIADHAYRVDGKLKASPIVRDIESHKEVPFDSEIVYIKGAAIVTMMEGHFGKRPFKKAMQRYLRKHDHGTVVTEDLWKQLLKFAKGFNVSDFYHNWIYKAGVPTIRVTREENHILLRQQRFLLSEEPTEEVIWHIPVTYYKDGKKETFLFEEKEKTIPNIKEDAAIKFNVDHEGYYITKYDDWNQLSSLIGSNYLTARDYAGLLLDIHYLTQSNVYYGAVLPLVGQILNATNHVVPWRMVMRMIMSIDDFMKTVPTNRQHLSALVNSWLKNKYHKGLWDEGRQSDQEIRFSVTIITLSCYFGHQPCLDDAKELFDKWKRSPDTKLLPNMRELIYCNGLAASTEEEDLDFVWQKYVAARDTPVVKYKSELRKGLSCVRNENLVNLYLTYVWQEKETQKDDFFIFMTNIAKNPHAVEAAWKKFSDKDEFPKLRNELPDQKLGDLVVTFAGQFADKKKRGEIVRLIARGRAFLNHVKKAMEVLDHNISMVGAYESAFEPE